MIILIAQQIVMSGKEVLWTINVSGIFNFPTKILMQNNQTIRH